MFDRKREVFRNSITAFAVTLAVGTLSQVGAAQGLTYVEADAFNVTPIEALLGGNSGVDNLWRQRTAFGSGGTILESGTSIEDSDELTQSIFGLVPNQSYDFYAVYWTDIRENWGIMTGTTAGNLSAYNFYSESGLYPSPGTPRGFTAGAAKWDAPPPPTDDVNLDPQPASYVFTQRTASVPLVMLLAPVGTVLADEFGQAQIYIDDTPVGMTGGRWRTWFDGVAYTTPGTIVSMTASIDRLTGELTVTNPTASDFQVKSVSLRSAAGELIGSNWDPITGRLDGSVGGDTTFDLDEWAISTPADPNAVPYALELTEGEVLANNGIGGTLVANGGTLEFGEGLVRRTPFEDVLVYLTLADDTLAILSPEYTNGSRHLHGDFDADEDIDLVDYEVLLANMHGSVAGTIVERHEQGDISGNGLVNSVDFLSFRVAFDDFNGEGAFAAMTAHVPEPSSFALLTAICGALLFIHRRRISIASATLLVSIAFAGQCSAVTYLAVDVDDRAGDAVAGPDGDNTVPGYESFTITGITGTTTRELGSYTVSLLAMDANNVASCCFDDRDRSQPDGTPTLNQLYDDFIFTAGGVGVQGGVDVEISGGDLLPNRHYEVGIYAYDRSSTGNRVANWTDPNNSNFLIAQTLFNGSTLPTTDDRYRFVGFAKTDGTGKLILRGRSAMPVATDAGLFLNGFEISDALAISLEVNTQDGTVQFVNHSGTDLDMSYYEIRSASGALNNGSWTSLDLSEGPVGSDPIGSGWDESPNLSASLLSELNVQSSLTLGAAAEDSFASIGSAFNVGPARDIEFFYAAPGETTLTRGIVSYVTSNFNPGGPAGDFNGDGIVNAADYVLGRDQGPAGFHTDFFNNFGATPGSGSGAAAAIPEPATIGLLAVALLGLGLVRKRS